MVGHLRGRQLNPVKIEIYRADVSHRLQRLHECSIGVCVCVVCVECFASNVHTVH